MRVKSYTEAVRVANSAGLDAAKKRMRKSGRKVMSASDYDHACSVIEKFLCDLGFDTAGWRSTAGLQRNEPETPPARKKAVRRSKTAPVQLSFALYAPGEAFNYPQFLFRYDRQLSDKT